MIFRKRLYFLEKKHGFLWPFPAKPTPASILRRSTSFDYKDAAEINAPVGRASGVSEKKNQRWMVRWMGWREHKNRTPLIWWGKSWFPIEISTETTPVNGQFKWCFSYSSPMKTWKIGRLKQLTNYESRCGSNRLWTQWTLQTSMVGTYY
jgi:hypothetical protein